MDAMTETQETLVKRLEALIQTVREEPLDEFLRGLMGLTADMIAVMTLSSKQLSWPRDICDAIFNDSMEMVVAGIGEEECGSVQ